MSCASPANDEENDVFFGAVVLRRRTTQMELQ